MRRGPSAAAACASASLVLAGCAADGAFAPQGTSARAIATLWWVMLTAATAITVLVFFLVLRGTLRRGDATVSSSRDRRFYVLGGVALPAIVLGALAVLNLGTLSSQPQAAEDAAIEVVGHQFWWEVRYADPAFVTANEVHIPAGEDVTITMTAQDVNHSFWVPEVAGKRDLIPGEITEIVLHADEPGTYRGRCAEFCGLQHANMAFVVIAHEPADYEAWLADAAAPAPEPQTESQRVGYDTFFQVGCAGCHAVRGTPAEGQRGPNLTNFADRFSIGAGAAPNDRGHLGGWVANAQSLKPGSEMPPIEIPAERLSSLLDYLETLR